MPCERFRDALTDAAAGAPVGTALEAHLAACNGCRSELAQLRDVMATADEALSMLAAAEPSPALRARIREAVGGQVPVGPAPWWRFAWPAAAAAVLALAALGAWRSAVARPPVAPALAERARPAASDASPDAMAAVDTRPSTGPGSAVAGARQSRSAAPPEPDAASAGLRSAAPRSAAPARPVGAETSAPKVLVPPGGQEALLRFVALAHREGVASPALAASGLPSADLKPPVPLDIRPLEIVPLDPAAESGT